MSTIERCGWIIVTFGVALFAIRNLPSGWNWIPLAPEVLVLWMLVRHRRT